MNNSLKISTYNIQHGTNSQKILENIVKLAQEGVTLFCLQEVRHHPNKLFIVDLLLKNLGPTWKAEYLISSGSFDLGLCTLWNTSIINQKSFEVVFLPKLSKIRLYEKVYLKFHRKLEKVDSKNITPETKAALIGQFELNGKLLRITNTHLDWLGGVKHRSNQLEHIKNKLASSTPHVLEIICGDFNTLGYYRFGKKITRQISCIFSEEFLSVFKNTPTTTFYQTLDHVLIKNLQLMRTEILKLKGSDHYPLLVEVRV